MKKNIFLMVCIAIAAMALNYMSFIPVKCAISNLNAYWSCINGGAIIISYDSDGLGSFYNKGMSREYVTLIGRNPYNEISGRLLRNRVLVKGKFRDDIGQFYNKKVFEVSDWDIIFPVIREYSCSDYQKSRLISPIFYIDQFDIETGDIHEYRNAAKSISRLEAEYLAYTNNDNYIIVTPEIKEHEILWHSVKLTISNNHDLKKEVNENTIWLRGENLPEDTLNRNVLFNGSISKYINKFLIYGYKKGNIIHVNEWKIIVPFENSITGRGKTFLDEDDFLQICE